MHQERPQATGQYQALSGRRGGPGPLRFDLNLDMRPVGLICGLVLLILSAFMLPSMLADISAQHDDWKVFFFSSILTAFIGGLLYLTNQNAKIETLTARQGFLITAAVWMFTCTFASLPLALSELELSVADAIFESTSGLTTTGATVITNLEGAPPGILVWRASLQWLGGIGIIVMGIAILPMLNVGGMQLFRTESSDLSDKILPRAGQLSTAIGTVYILLTLACTLAYMYAGMRVFDAITHSMTTVSTGGFSTLDRSLGGFESPAVEWIAIIFMILGGLPFVVYIQLQKNQFKPLIEDIQIRWFLSILFLASVALITVPLLNQEHSLSITDTIRHGVFSTVAVMTGTGFSSTNYDSWGTFAQALVFFLMCVGGCTGSTTGGIKIFRFVIIYKITVQQILKLIQPSGVFKVIYNGRTVADATAAAVLGFMFMFALSFSILTIILAAIGLDYLTAMSASLSALANVGPGLGEIVGPAGHFGDLPQAAKWALSAGMILGRLELFTIIVLFSVFFWRH